MASVSLSESTLALSVGATEALVATVSPSNADNKAKSWSSSDTTVATVDPLGNVTAVGAGTATITVRTTDGNKTDTCAVTVTASDEA